MKVREVLEALKDRNPDDDLIVAWWSKTSFHSYDEDTDDYLPLDDHLWGDVVEAVGDDGAMWERIAEMMDDSVEACYREVRDNA